jgi:hypothetical protein
MSVLFLGEPRRTTIVVADSAFVVLQSLNKELLRLEDYPDGQYVADTSRQFDSPDLKRMFEVLRTRQTTSIADLRITSSILERYAARSNDIVISHARNVRVRDFSTSDNLLLMGSKLSNPWTTLFESPLNFRFEKAPIRGSRIRNLQPKPGEEEWYAPKDPVREVGTDYALISVQLNHNGSGRIMTIAGTMMEGTEAAGDFALNPPELDPVESLWGYWEHLNSPTYARKISGIPTPPPTRRASYSPQALSCRRLLEAVLAQARLSSSQDFRRYTRRESFAYS